MGTFSIWHWLIVIAACALYLWPVSRILKKAGFSPLWCIVALFGPLAWFGLWVLAYTRWPIEDRR